jgi:hypothetical protein
MELIAIANLGIVPIICYAHPHLAVLAQLLKHLLKSALPVLLEHK